MTTNEIASMIAEIGIPYAYYQFPEGTDQAPPFACFFLTGNNDFLADNANYQKIEHLVVEVYSKAIDFSLEATVEGVLADHEMVYSREETWLDDERMVEVIYEMDVIITEGVTTNGE